MKPTNAIGPPAGALALLLPLCMLVDGGALALGTETVVAGPDLSSQDDGPALQSAIDQAAHAGGIVRIKSGLYHLNVRDGIRTLAPRANVRIVGDGPERTILRLNDGQTPYQGVFYPEHEGDDLSGFGLEALTIDQNADGNAVEAAADLRKGSRAVLAVFAGSNVRVERCRFTRLAGTNSLVFNGGHVSDVQIADNEFDLVGNSGTAHYDHSTVYTHADRVRITNNTFSGRVAGGGAPGATTAIETHGSHQVVAGNQIQDYLQGMNITGIADESEDLVITGNSISSAATGIQLWSYLFGSNTTQPAMTSVIVSQNVVTIDRDRWVSVAGTPGLPAAGILISPRGDAAIRGLRIERNVIVFGSSAKGTPSDDQSAGIEMWLVNESVTSHGVSVIQNDITGAYGPGIRLSMPCDGVEISRNRIQGPGTSTGQIADPFRSGILISHLQHDMIVRDNAIVDDTGRMLFGIYDATVVASTGLQLFGNQIQTSATAAQALHRR